MSKDKIAQEDPNADVSPEHIGHHHHGWLSKHFCTRNLKKLGALGVILFVLHILFHVVEILLIPTILVWLGWK